MIHDFFVAKMQFIFYVLWN